jgi:hypothetical protein
MPKNKKLRDGLFSEEPSEIWNLNFYPVWP